MRNLRHLIRRSGLLSTEKRRRRSEQARRSDFTQRRLSSEVLEKRELLAGDILASNHNYWNSYDVNDDGRISARDALGVINYLGQSGEAELVAADGPMMFYDVNADHNVTAADALGVINAMSRGEEVGELVELLITARDLNDQQIPADGNGEINLEVDQEFFIEVSYDDLRTGGGFGQRNDLGVFQLFTDITVSQAGVLSPVLNETQRLIIDDTIRTVNSESVTFSIPEAPPGVSGASLTYESLINDFSNNPAGEVAEALREFGYTIGQFEISTLDFGSGGDLGFQVHWVGDEFGNVDLPNISVDVNETNSADNIPTQTVEFAPFEADGVTPNTDAVRFNVNTFSRTFNNNEQFYSAQNRGEFDPATGFSGVGGLGMVPIEGGGIPDLTDDGGFIEPFDAFSLRVFIKQPVTDLVVGVNPGEDDEATLLYGRDDAVPQDLVLIETDPASDAAGNGIANMTINATAPGNPGTFNITSTANVNEDAGTVTLTVSRSGGIDGAVSVDFATANQSAMAGSDYTATSDTLNFGQGQTSMTISVPILDDSLDESDETFTVTLSNPTGGATIGSSQVSTITIIDNDVPGVFAFADASQTVGEGDGSIILTVNRTGGTDGAVSVPYSTADGTAEAGSDYTTISGTLNFAHGQSSATIEVPIINDTLDENNETFLVNLGTPTAGSLGANDSATVTIVDNDVAQQPGVFAFASSSESVGEGAGSITLTVNRTNGTDGAVAVPFMTANGSAIAGSDYSANTDTLNFADGQDSATITVLITDDSEDESNETFSVNLGAPSAGGSLGTIDSVVVTILDNDEPGVFNITSTANVVENAGSVTLTVTRTSGSDGEVTVTYNTGDGTATAPSDYTAVVNGTLTFGNGVTSQTITVPIINDTLDENNETFTVTLSNPTGGATLGATTQSTVTIVDDDQVTPVPGVLSIAPTVSVNEDAGTASITVTRTGGSDGEVTVTYNTGDGTATAPSDYTAVVNGTLTFGNGVMSQTISVPIINDTLDENNETFTVTLSNPTGGATLGTTTQSTVTILDDDQPGVLSISPGSTSVSESGGSVTFTVLRTGGSDGTVSVNFATANGSASAGQDYTANSDTLTFGDGVTSRTFTVSILDDNVDEPDETFTATLSSPTGGATLGSVTTSTVTILDNDLPGGIPGSTVSGWIFIDNDENPDPTKTVRNGEKESDERGLGGVDVHLVSMATGQTVAHAITDVDGFYDFENVAPGQYEVGHDIPDEAIISVSPTELPVTIPSSGGVVITPVNFPILETTGCALNSLDLLASSFREDQGFELGDKGREGGIALLDEDGNLEFIVLGSGFDGITDAELVLNDARDAALLTVIEEDGDIRSALIDSEHFEILENGCLGVQFLGGLNDLDFFDPSDSLGNEFEDFGNLIDRVMQGM